MISDIVFYLLRKGAHREPKRITTGEIAEQLGVSQQTASRKLIELEKAGELERSGGRVRLTEKALVGVRRLMREVLDSLKGTGLVFSGKVVPGLGEGGFFVVQKEYMQGFRKKLGFVPFRGTLNVFIEAEEVEKRLILREQKAVEIPGFHRGSRQFGKIDAYRCVVGGLPGAIIFPEKSQHGLQMLEIIAPVNLRKSLGLQDGTTLSVEVVDSQPVASGQAEPHRHSPAAAAASG